MYSKLHDAQTSDVHEVGRNLPPFYSVDWSDVGHVPSYLRRLPLRAVCLGLLTVSNNAKWYCITHKT